MVMCGVLNCITSEIVQVNLHELKKNFLREKRLRSKHKIFLDLCIRIKWRLLTVAIFVSRGFLNR